MRYSVSSTTSTRHKGTLMDYAKLALAAQIRSEALKQMGVDSIKHTRPIKTITHPDATYAEHVYDILREVIETAEIIDKHVASGGHLVKFG